MAEGNESTSGKIYGPFLCDVCKIDRGGQDVSIRLFRCSRHFICGFCDDIISIIDSTQACPVCRTLESPAERDQGTMEALERGTTRQNIVLVMGKSWDNIMESPSSVGQDLAAFIARLGIANVYSIVERAERQHTFDALGKGVSLYECNRDNLDDNLALVHENIQEIDTLIGFVPDTRYLIDAIIDVITVNRVILIHCGAVHSPEEYHYHGLTTWSLGPLIGRTVEANTIGVDHNILVPAIADDIRVNIKETQARGCHFICPLVIQQSSHQYLESHGFKAALSAVRLYANSKNIDPIITMLLENMLMANTRDITELAEACGIRELRFRSPRSSSEWIHEIRQASLALCTSRQSAFDHWVFKLIESNVPFLVVANSGMGHVLCETHPFAIVQTVQELNPDDTSDAEKWFLAIENILEDFENTLIDFCHGHGEFNRRHKEGFIPLVAQIFPMSELTFRPVGNEGEIEDIKQEIRDKFQHLTAIITRMDLLEISKASIKLKCESTNPMTREDLDVEKRMVKMYRDFQKLGQTILRVDHGSLVFTVLSHSEEDATKLEDLNADGSLLRMIQHYCVGHGSNDSASFSLTLKAVHRRNGKQLRDTPHGSSRITDKDSPDRAMAGPSKGSPKPIFEGILDLRGILQKKQRELERLGKKAGSGKQDILQETQKEGRLGKLSDSEILQETQKNKRLGKIAWSGKQEILQETQKKKRLGKIAASIEQDILPEVSLGIHPYSDILPETRKQVGLGKLSDSEILQETQKKERLGKIAGFGKQDILQETRGEFRLGNLLDFDNFYPRCIWYISDENALAMGGEIKSHQRAASICLMYTDHREMYYPTYPGLLDENPGVLDLYPGIVDGVSLGNQQHAVLFTHDLCILQLNKGGVIELLQHVHVWLGPCIIEINNHEFGICDDEIIQFFKMVMDPDKITRDRKSYVIEGKRFDKITSQERMFAKGRILKPGRSVYIGDIHENLSTLWTHAAKPVYVLPDSGDMYVIGKDEAIYNYNADGTIKDTICQKGDSFLPESFEAPVILVPHPKGGVIVGCKNGVIVRYRGDTRTWEVIRDKGGRLLSMCSDGKGYLYCRHGWYEVTATKI